jgi:hypothetical protein
MTPAINPCLVVKTVDKFLTGVNDTSKIIAGDNDTGDKIIAGDNDTGEKIYYR